MVRGCIREVEQILECFEQIDDSIPPFLMKGPKQGPGRQEQLALNTAILEIDGIFRTSGLSDHKALIHTHSLLYAAGIWPDPEEQGLTFKLFQLHRLSSSKNLP